MPSFILFGTGHFAEEVLKTLLALGCAPKHIITSPDKPVGRHQVMTPSVVKVLAVEHNIPYSTPEKLRTEDSLSEMKRLIDTVDVCVVVDYGKILPQALLDLCPKGFVNIHPSRLPEHRGPAPLQATILSGNLNTAISIIKIDAEMDHGPLLVQKMVTLPEVMTTVELTRYLGPICGQLLVDILPKYMSGELILQEQNHDKATYTKMIDKKDAEVSVSDILHNLAGVYLKYCAYKPWPEIFFIHNGKRIKIKSMNPDEILRVIPEGKTEISWSEYVKYHPL